MGHDCYYCARWRELGEAFDEGRKKEAATEAWRAFETGRDGCFTDRPDCKTATRVLARMKAMGYGRDVYGKHQEHSLGVYDVVRHVDVSGRPACGARAAGALLVDEVRDSSCMPCRIRLGVVERAREAGL